MQGYERSFGIGVVAGMRSLSACAALTWAASLGRTRDVPVPSGPGALSRRRRLSPRWPATRCRSPPDRRIPPSFAVRLVIGTVGGWALAGRRASPEVGALAGMAGAVAGTFLGRAARGPDARTASGRTKGLVEDAVAAGLATFVVVSAERRSRSYQAGS